MTRGRYGIFRGAAALLWLSGTLVAGCASERAVLTTGPGMTYEELRSGGLAIVGVTKIDEVEQIRPPLIATLEQVLRESRPDLPFRTADTVRDSLGLSQYRRILSAYQSAGKLSDGDRGVLAARLRGSARFALLARVDKDAVRLPPARRSATGAYGAGSPQFGTRAASRDTRVRVNLYDLQTGAEAWSAIYASSTDNVLPDSVSRLPNRLLLPRQGSPMEVPIEPLPETPTLAQALIEGFRAFVADLPKATGTPAAR